MCRKPNVAGLLLFSLVALAGCRADEPGVYTVRGQIVAAEGDSVLVAHEAIEGFVDREGNASPMSAMSMPFGVGPGVDRAALTPGSKWELTFDVVWEREPILQLRAARRLPDDTPLELAGGIS
jgi:hypothetical protein